MRSTHASTCVPHTHVWTLTLLGEVAKILEGKPVQTMANDPIYVAFGRAVAARRKELALTQADLASRVGLSRGSVAHVERGSQKVLLHQVVKFAAALELPSARMLIPSMVVAEPVAHAERVELANSKERLTADQRRLIDTLYGSVSR